MKKKNTKKVPAVVEQEKTISLDALIKHIDETSGNMIALSYALRRSRDNQSAA